MVEIYKTDNKVLQKLYSSQLPTGGPQGFEDPHIGIVLFDSTANAVGKHRHRCQKQDRYKGKQQAGEHIL